MQKQKLKDVVLECHEMWSHVLKHTKKHQNHQKTMENREKRGFWPKNGVFCHMTGGATGDFNEAAVCSCTRAGISAGPRCAHAHGPGFE